MQLEEIEKLTNDPNPIIDKHQLRILRDVALLMKLHNLKDSNDVDEVELVAIIQKERIA
jgi:hypothetical protein